MRLGEPVRLKIEVGPHDTKHCRSGAGSAIFFKAPGNPMACGFLYCSLGARPAGRCA
jgi:hypothetical protein